MASSSSRIQPVWGDRRRKSCDLLETADTLMDNLDNLSDIMDQISVKYTDADSIPEDSTPNTGTKRLPGNDSLSGEPSLFKKLKDGLEAARNLIGCLKREKARLTKREFSVELRMTELEDYKTHMKQDLTSLNEMVDMLSVRVVQLEHSLCEEQDVVERTEAEKTELEDRLHIAESLCAELIEDKDEREEEIKKLRKQRTDSSLQRENCEFRGEIEILIEENCRLKEMLRIKRDPEMTSDGDLAGEYIPIVLEDKSNNNSKDHLEKY